MTSIRAQLSKYEFNLRSFHPEKDFGWSGLKFSGDSRGFSLKPSGKFHGTKSRIWHRITLDLLSLTVVDRKVESDESKAAWSDTAYQYEDSRTKPTLSLFQLPTKKTPEYRLLPIKGKYSGSNHAMPLSDAMQKTLGFTYVPEIDVSYDLYLKFNVKENWLEIGTRIVGDGFANTEAFITDAKGNAVFLGTHVRQGAAPITLGANYTHLLIKNVIRIPLNVHGHFQDTLTDEGNKYLKNLRKAQEYKIKDWNNGYLNKNPNQGRCMGLEEFKRFQECF